MTRVAGIGGGIGGLVAARALTRRGVEVAIYEAAPELRESPYSVTPRTRCSLTWARAHARR